MPSLRDLRRDLKRLGVKTDEIMLDADQYDELVRQGQSIAAEDDEDNDDIED